MSPASARASRVPAARLRSYPPRSSTNSTRPMAARYGSISAAPGSGRRRAADAAGAAQHSAGRGNEERTAHDPMDCAVCLEAHRCGDGHYRLGEARVHVERISRPCPARRRTASIPSPVSRAPQQRRRRRPLQRPPRRRLPRRAAQDGSGRCRPGRRSSAMVGPRRVGSTVLMGPPRRSRSAN
jgi:hypothetical protein